MSQHTESAAGAGVPVYTESQHQSLLAAACAEATQAGEEAERARIGAILGGEAAKGREALANHFAFKTSMKAEDALAALAAAPVAVAAPAPAKTHRLDAIAPDPKVDSDAPASQASLAAGLNAAVDRLVSARS